jgi:two-component system, NarL family, nitrate/nitrite response regulator NarL
METLDIKVPEREWNGNKWVITEMDIHITPREIEILNGLAFGKSNKIIASELSNTEGTIKNHVSALMQKFDASNRTILAIKAYKMGMVEI